MRKGLLYFTVLAAFCISHIVSLAQAPAAFNFQGVARESIGNAPLDNKEIILRFTIRTGNTNGTIVYQESRTVPTNQYGVFNTVIGGAGATAVIGNLNKVTWKAEDKFLQVEMDAKNGSGLIDLGTTQLLSVPFAMFSNNANYADSSRNADSSQYARSSGSYFFEAFFPAKILTPHPNPRLPANIVFPRTKYNHLNMATGEPIYDSTSGIFTVPESGIYQIDFFAKSWFDGIAYDDLWVMKNGQKLKRAFMLDSHWPGEFDEGDEILDYFESHIRTYLEKGDIISVAYGSVCDEDVCDDDGVAIASGTYFSGYKIF